MADVDELIEKLANWRSGGWDGPSLRDSAIERLAERGDEATAVLVKRLRELLAEQREYEERFAAAKAEFDAWNAELDRVVEEARREGRVASDEELGAIGEQPTGLLELRGYSDPYELRQGIVAALHQIGDPKAADVLVEALRDRACTLYAARALRDIRADDPVDALLDGLVLTAKNGTVTREIAEIAIEYGVTAEQVVARLDGEETEQGRVNLMELLALTAEKAEVPAAVFLSRIDDESTEVRWAVTDGLGHLAASPEVEDALLVMALDEEKSVRWRAIRGLRQVRGEDTAGGGYTKYPLTDDVVREAWLVKDERVGGRVRARLADLEDPMPVVRALRKLAADGDERAGEALLSGQRLFRLMVADATAEEAKGAFDEVAGPADRARFEEFEAAQPRSRAKRRSWFRRR